MNISAKRRGVWILMVGAVIAVALASNDARAQSEPSFVFDPRGRNRCRTIGSSAA